MEDVCVADSSEKRPRGRPREFEADQALAAALRVFWRRGYEAASLTELTEEMGITRPSLYACFGNKEELFRKALDLYQREKLAYIQTALDAPSARGVARRLLEGSLALQSGSCDEPKGCLAVIASVAGSQAADSIKAEVAARRVDAEVALVKRLGRAVEEGDLPEGSDPRAMARYLTALMQGISLQGSAGASADELRNMVEAALAMWPGK